MGKKRNVKKGKTWKKWTCPFAFVLHLFCFVDLLFYAFILHLFSFFPPFLSLLFCFCVFLDFADLLLVFSFFLLLSRFFSSFKQVRISYGLADIMLVYQRVDHLSAVIP